MWFDSHSHLHLCEDATSDVLERARVAGVDRVLTVGIDVESSKTSVELASASEGVFASVGVHPNSSDEWDDEARWAIGEMCALPEVVAVGETGLDFYRDRVAHDVQRAAFEDHIMLAKDKNKALVIHTRQSMDAALDVLTAMRPPERFVFHCWSGDRSQLRRALELGAYISFAGNVSFKNAADLQDVAAVVPGDKLLVETDSPYLAPVPHRGQPNEPRLVTMVGVALARCRGVNVDEVGEQTAANARRLFALG